MTDYIKRDIERIIANAQECDIDALTWEEQKERLKAVKSADVVPVVRCEDCLWYVRSMIKQDGTLDERYKPDWCDLYRRGREETYFCADGERKDNG